MTKIFNGTPHAINVVSGSVFVPKMRKYVGGDVVRIILSDGMLNAKQLVTDLPSIDDIPVFGMSFTGVDPLPEGYDVYIVSAMYASAAREAGVNMNKIFTVKDPVYTDDGNTFLGCRGICPAF